MKPHEKCYRLKFAIFRSVTVRQCTRADEALVSSLGAISRPYTTAIEITTISNLFTRTDKDWTTIWLMNFERVWFCGKTDNRGFRLTSGWYVLCACVDICGATVVGTYLYLFIYKTKRSRKCLEYGVWKYYNSKLVPIYCIINLITLVNNIAQRRWITRLLFY